MASDEQRQAWRDAIAAQHKQQRRQRARPATPQVTGVRVPAPAHWTHKDCGQPVMFDLGDGFCLGCHAEGLDEGDVNPPEATDG